jgi:hypothetical protein
MSEEIPGLFDGVLTVGWDQLIGPVPPIAFLQSVSYSSVLNNL